jgi:hypothetical protein
VSYLTIDEARDKLRQATRVVLNLEGEFERASERAADAEAVYRKDRAEALRRYRDAGEAATAAETLARGDTAVQKREALAAAGALKLAGEKLENGRDSRRSLWRLIEWSRDHDRPGPTQNGPAQQPLPENVPRERWP